MTSSHSRQIAAARAGFTLIELLVAMSITLVLAGLIVAFAYRANELSGSTSGAVQVVGALKMAQAWALRDQTPRGIRLTPTTVTYKSTTFTGVTSLQYIDQPDDFLGPAGSSVTVTNNVVTATGVDFTGGGTSPVNVGDYLEIGSAGGTPAVTKVYTISAVNSATQLTLFQPPSGAVTLAATTLWRIPRQPRPRVGEPAVSLPQYVAIDLNANQTNGGYPGNLGGNIDILFAPSGAVISKSAGQDYRLWVRDYSIDPPPVGGYGGDQFIISVGVRSGFISTQRVDTTSNGAGGYANPYANAQSSRSSGF